MNQKKIKTTCPPWAEKLIEQLHQVEIYLGHLKPEKSWESKKLSAAHTKVFGEQTIREEHSELLFCKIVTGLRKEGFSSSHISQVINERIPSAGEIHYCNEEEVNSVS